MRSAARPCSTGKPQSGASFVRGIGRSGPPLERAIRSPAVASGASGRGLPLLLTLEQAAEGRDDLAVELRSGLAAQLGDRLLRRAGDAERARTGHALPRVHDREDAAADRDRLAGEPARVPRPV